ncbi:hypothetical protein PY365_04530 [Roseiarcaceae bacterium H3SJ34-1]|uniref:hypothetical protein n=1 Tax=Terripilifer ovatus TaxID=3032367 RepID=UPI003AB923E1|nr:hypothetical protein [Roseiarcaceae bacterium H3SJ34-1]
MENRFLFLTLDEAGAGSHGAKLYLVLNDLGQLLVEREDWTRDGKRSSFVPVERVLQQPGEDVFRRQVEAGLRKRLDYARHDDGKGVPVFDLMFEGKAIATNASKAEIARAVAALAAGKQIAGTEQDYFERRLADRAP